jgi:ABC-type maltose transport system permease subunit
MQLPAALRIVKTYFDTMSHDYGEAALVDGTNLFSAYSPRAFLGVQQIDYGFL